MSTSRVLLLFVVAVSFACAHTSPGGNPDPRLTQVLVPEEVEIREIVAPAVFVTVVGEDLDPFSEQPVNLSVTNRDGKRIEALFSNELTVQDLVIGRGKTALLVLESGMTTGEYQLCADIRPMAAGQVCANVFFQVAPDPCVQAFVAAVQANPTFGCRCKSAEILLDRTKSPTPSLGSFTAKAGGNKFGEFHARGLAQATFTSVSKFEASFIVEAVNEPARPAACSKEKWQMLIAAVLCTEGQNINSEIVFRAGAQNEIKVPTKGPKVAGQPRPEFPYTAGTKDPAKFTQDGHGYKVAGNSADPTIKGNLKAYDFPKIHWLDGPGLTEAHSKHFKGLNPARQDSRFHAYVHGSSNTNADNCDCYFDLRNGVLDAQGNAGASTVLANPVCE